MLNPNPLVVEVLRGLGQRGQAQLDHLNYLLVQALVLFLWWPKTSLPQMLESEGGAPTLVALVVALGAIVSYYAVRAGAEEILLPGQHALREWAHATSLPLARILVGYLGGQLLQILHALALSSPLLLAAFHVAGADGVGLAWCLTAIVFQATFYRLAGAVVYLAIGHHGTLTFFCVRAALVLGYVLAQALLPVASHPAMSSRLLNRVPSMQPTVESLPEPLIFVLVYAALSTALAAVLYALLSRQRASTGAPPGRRNDAPQAKPG